MSDIEEKIEELEGEEELEELQEEKEERDAIKKLRSMLGMGESGWRILILRMSHPFLKGPVDEFQWSKDIEISWQDLQARHGGGDFKVQLRDEKGKVRRSTTFTIPGAAKWKGKVVTCRADVEKVDRNEETGEVPQVIQKESSNEIMGIILQQMNQQIQHQNDMMMLLQQQMQKQSENHAIEMREQIRSSSEQRENFMLEAMKMLSERNSAQGSSQGSMDVMKGAIATMGGMLNLTQKINDMTSPPPAAKEDDDDQTLMKMMANLFSMLMANKFQNNQPISPGMIPQGMNPNFQQRPGDQNNLNPMNQPQRIPQGPPVKSHSVGPVYDSPFSSKGSDGRGNPQISGIESDDYEDFEEEEDDELLNDMEELQELSSNTEKDAVDYVIDKE